MSSKRRKAKDLEETQKKAESHKPKKKNVIRL